MYLVVTWNVTRACVGWGGELERATTVNLQALPEPVNPSKQLNVYPPSHPTHTLTHTETHTPASFSCSNASVVSLPTPTYSPKRD